MVQTVDWPTGVQPWCVEDFLNDTMLAAAYSGGEKKASASAYVRSTPLPLPLLEHDEPKKWLNKPSTPKYKGKNLGEYEREHLPIWDHSKPIFQETESGSVVKVTHLTCLASGMQYANMTVCDSIEWGPVSCESEYFQGTVPLPLDKDHLIPDTKRYLVGGTIPGGDDSHKFWKLPVNADKSFEWVFGYEFPIELIWKTPPPSGEPKTLKKDADMSGFAQQEPSFYHFAKSNQNDSHSNTLRSASLRIIVVVTLVCCKEADYGPFLKGGRFLPMIMVLSNQELKAVKGKVKLTRPSQIKGMDDCCHPEAKNSLTVTMKEEGEEMTRDLGAVLFTDNNSIPLEKSPADFLLSPRWDHAFAYYDVDPSCGTYVLAYPHSYEKPTPIPDAPVSTYDTMSLPTQYPWQEPSRVTFSGKRIVEKWPGQGEFDNLHIAPKMVLRRSNLTTAFQIPIKNLLGLKGDDDRLDDIAMSPFCIHDCMHMHVRWAVWIPDSPFIGGPEYAGWGWKDGEMLPNVTAGAPHVPANQKVTLNLKTRTSFEYVAEAKGVSPARWQIMMHHGAAYALDTQSIDWWLRQCGSESGLTPKKGSKWAMFYWNLRWVVGKDNQQHERLSFSKDTLKKLRQFVAK